MRQCCGLKRNLIRCQRRGDWNLFCDEHKRQPFYWLFVLVFTVIAGSASICSCAFRPSPQAPPQQVESTNTVLRIRPDDQNIVIPSMSDHDQKYMILPLILWCDTGTTYDLDGIVMQQFDDTTKQFIGPISSLTDAGGKEISFPLRIADTTKTHVVFHLPVGSTNEPHLKAKVKFVGYKPKDTTVVDVEILRKPEGYQGMVMSHQRHYEFGKVVGTGHQQTNTFLKPYRELPDVSLKEQ